MFARKKELLNQTTNTKKYGYKRIQHYIKQAKNILDESNNNPNELQRELIQICIDNVAYDVQHPKFKSNVKTRSFYKLINKAKETFKPIKGVDTSKLKDIR